MIKYLPSRTVVDDESFPYDFQSWDYPEEVLRSSLYSIWWTEIPEDSNEELSIVMDYDGFIEWYNSKREAWMMEDDSYPDFTAEEYLPYHIGRTIAVVKIVKE